MSAVIDKKLEKEIFACMDVIDEINPYATYLDKSTLSSVKDWIDTGSMVLNAQISGSLYGGIPDGRIVQFAGASQTGKSFFVQKIIANAQKMGKYVIIFDSENAIDKESAASFGIDPTKVKYVSTESVESTRNEIKRVLKEARERGLIGRFLIIIDSIGNLETELGEDRMDKDSKASDMGTFAKSVKSLLKTCTNWGRKTRTPIVVTNHIFDNPAEMYPSLEKNMAGGKAAIYLPSVTLQLARKAAKDDGGKTIDADLAASQKNFSGVIIRSLSVKNRFMKQYIEVETYLSFSKGLDRYYGLLEVMKGMGVVIANGATYTDWNGNKLGYYKAWRKNTDLWENTLLPELELRIKENWCYGNKLNEEISDAELDSEADDVAGVDPERYLEGVQDGIDDTEFDDVPDEEED